MTTQLPVRSLDETQDLHVYLEKQSAYNIDLTI